TLPRPPQRQGRGEIVQPGCQEEVTQLSSQRDTPSSGEETTLGPESRHKRMANKGLRQPESKHSETASLFPVALRQLVSESLYLMRFPPQAARQGECEPEGGREAAGVA